MRFGLLGRSIGYSYSPKIHNMLAGYPYELFQVEPEALEDFFLNVPFKGINVTIPYKKAVIPFCTALTPQAQQLGAVNTIIRQKDGSLIGHNTDYFGFQTMLQHSGLSVAGKKVLVLGSGGASATVVAVLQNSGAVPVVISRSGENNYNNLSRHKDAAILVNATPVGTFPEVECSPVDLSVFPALEGVLDLIYNPARTQLLLDAEERGLVTENGLRMLVAQAKEAAEWFTGNAIDNSSIDSIHHTMCKTMQNIVLIGMPGCGKSTIGKLLAEKLGREFVDTDTAIEQAVGKTIPDIFRQDGEEAFRNAETAVLLDLGKRSGLIIATGGGCVTKDRNYLHLHRNGMLFWIQRPLGALATDGRPLSQASNLAAMYAVREPLYTRFADVVIQNDLSPESTVADILKHLEA